MTFPDWIVPDGRYEVYADAQGQPWMRSGFRVRRWHPGYWAAWLGARWRTRR